MQNWIITAMVNHDEGHTVTLIKQLDTDRAPCLVARECADRFEREPPSHRVLTAILIHGEHTMQELVDLSRRLDDLPPAQYQRFKFHDWED